MHQSNTRILRETFPYSRDVVKMTISRLAPRAPITCTRIHDRVPQATRKMMLSHWRGCSRLPGRFWILKIGPLLREIWPKTSRKVKFSWQITMLLQWDRCGPLCNTIAHQIHVPLFLDNGRPCLHTLLILRSKCGLTLCFIELFAVVGKNQLLLSTDSGPVGKTPFWCESVGQMYYCSASQLILSKGNKIRWQNTIQSVNQISWLCNISGHMVRHTLPWIIHLHTSFACITRQPWHAC